MMMQSTITNSVLYIATLCSLQFVRPEQQPGKQCDIKLWYLDLLVKGHLNGELSPSQSAVKETIENIIKQSENVMLDCAMLATYETILGVKAENKAEPLDKEAKQTTPSNKIENISGNGKGDNAHNEIDDTESDDTESGDDDEDPTEVDETDEEETYDEVKTKEGEATDHETQNLKTINNQTDTDVIKYTKNNTKHILSLKKLIKQSQGKNSCTPSFYYMTLMTYKDPNISPANYSMTSWEYLESIACYFFKDLCSTVNETHHIKTQNLYNIVNVTRLSCIQCHIKCKYFTVMHFISGIMDLPDNKTRQSKWKAPNCKRKRKITLLYCYYKGLIKHNLTCEPSNKTEDVSDVKTNDDNGSNKEKNIENHMEQPLMNKSEGTDDTDPNSKYIKIPHALHGNQDSYNINDITRQYTISKTDIKDEVKNALKETEAQHALKIQLLELELLKLENKLLTSSMVKQNDSSTLTQLHNTILKLENELLKLNQSFTDIKMKTDVMYKSQQDEKKYPALPPSETETKSLEMVEKQKSELQTLAKVVQEQTINLEAMKARADDSDMQNKILQQTVMSQSLLISELMNKVESMTQMTLETQQQQQRMQYLMSQKEQPEGIIKKLMETSVNNQQRNEKAESSLTDTNVKYNIEGIDKTEHKTADIKDVNSNSKESNAPQLPSDSISEIKGSIVDKKDFNRDTQDTDSESTKAKTEQLDENAIANNPITPDINDKPKIKAHESNNNNINTIIRFFKSVLTEKYQTMSGVNDSCQQCTSYQSLKKESLQMGDVDIKSNKPQEAIDTVKSNESNTIIKDKNDEVSDSSNTNIEKRANNRDAEEKSNEEYKQQHDNIPNNKQLDNQQVEGNKQSEENIKPNIVKKQPGVEQLEGNEQSEENIKQNNENKQPGDEQLEGNEQSEENIKPNGENKQPGDEQLEGNEQSVEKIKPNGENKQPDDKKVEENKQSEENIKPNNESKEPDEEHLKGNEQSKENIKPNNENKQPGEQIEGNKLPEENDKVNVETRQAEQRTNKKTDENKPTQDHIKAKKPNKETEQVVDLSKTKQKVGLPDDKHPDLEGNTANKNEDNTKAIDPEIINNKEISNNENGQTSKKDVTKEVIKMEFPYRDLKNPGAKDCYDHLKNGRKRNQMMIIQPNKMRQTAQKVQVFCDMANGGWTIIQRRLDGKLDFYRNWHDYKIGFGNKLSEYWIGNQVLHYMTNQEHYTLRVELTDWDKNTVYAEYKNFQVSDEEDGFRLLVSGYSGTAGDSLSKHNGMKFSTYDVDNDTAEKDFNGSCAKRFHGAWWYYKCYKSNLNGKYYPEGRIPGKLFDGITWKAWKKSNYSMKRVEMKIRPTLDGL